jgi:hypothetical protein
MEAARMSKEGNKLLVVVVAREDPAPVGAALDHVLQVTGEAISGQTSHWS